MDANNLWSLRLGFSGREAALIKQQGIKTFLKNSFTDVPDTTMPEFLEGLPKSQKEISLYRKKLIAESGNEKEGNEKLKKQLNKAGSGFRRWWLQKMHESPYPLREKMTFFWHNHFVATQTKTYVPYWTYKHNQTLRIHAFGNFRELTKQAVRTNAVVKYLNNDKNRKGKYNENLSRELLELFTLGIGNYTEDDIKHGAKGLAGLNYGEEMAVYYPNLETNETFTYFGKTGNFKSDEMIDIIFQQKNAPYHITRKLLKWFIYDNPPEELVTYYGDYLREKDYEIQPLLTKMFTEEFNKPTAGSKIKDPLVFLFHLMDELHLKAPKYEIVNAFLKQQGMEPYNQPNVKGWEGGQKWLTAQLYLQRNNMADMLCRSKGLYWKLMENIDTGGVSAGTGKNFKPNIQYATTGNNKDIINQFKNRLIFNDDDNLQKDFETILKYDFDPKAEGAANGIMRLFNYMAKTPEFQII
ncbi:DUF1800 family protein [Flavobacterium rhizosphaerae]|uniref:DUF1800 family protein n=1 Tax=Flavobacterium rhizosphaerae TaxID=3163298 RepID=A0ABW8YSQ8_9FLAO